MNMVSWKAYLKPGSVDEALSALREAPKPCCIIAGGTDLLVEIEQGRRPPVHTLVDVTGIPELLTVRRADEHVILGAAVPHGVIVEDAGLKMEAACLVEACGLIGGWQVRNVATIGGNVAHALPAADGTIALLALDTEVQLASAQGRRWEPMESLFEGPGAPAFDTGREILVAFRFRPCGKEEGSSFRRVMSPQGVAIAVLNMAVWLRCTTDGIIEDVRLAAGPTGPRPLRLRATEEALRGKAADEDVLVHARESLLSEARLRTSRHRATKEYREHLLGVLLERAFWAAHKRAIGESAA